MFKFVQQLPNLFLDRIAPTRACKLNIVLRLLGPKSQFIIDSAVLIVLVPIQITLIIYKCTLITSLFLV